MCLITISLSTVFAPTGLPVEGPILEVGNALLTLGQSLSVSDITLGLASGKRWKADTYAILNIIDIIRIGYSSPVLGSLWETCVATTLAWMFL